MTTRLGIRIIWALPGLVALVAAPWVAHGVKAAPVNRPEDPVVVEVSSLPFLEGRSVDDPAVFAWDGQDFVPIPFQIDERGVDGGYFGDDDGVLDLNDEIVFMCEDLGERADVCCWVEGAEAERAELEIRDPRDPSRVGWCYVFCGASLPRSSEDYVTLLEEEPFTVTSDRYLERSVLEKPDVMEELRIFPPLGSGENFLDRFKIRTKLGLLSPWITEADPTHTVTRRQVKDGAIRIIHSYWVSMADLLDFTHAEHIYYRQMTVIRNDINQFWWPNLRHIALMMDRVPEAVEGVTFFDNRGGGPESGATFSDVVDGAGPHAAGAEGTFAEWASPRFGTVITIQDNSVVPLATGGAVHTYYCDEGVCTEDAWPATGDGENWGEYGLWLQKVRPERFQVEAWNPRLAGADTSRGGEFVSRYFHRPEVTVDMQAWEDCPCGTGVGGDVPSAELDHRMLEVLGPNPFNPWIEFGIRLSETIPLGALVIHDGSGRRVRVIREGPWGAGEHRIRWDGRTDGGRALPSGVYTVQWSAHDGGAERCRVVLLK